VETPVDIMIVHLALAPADSRNGAPHDPSWDSESSGIHSSGVKYIGEEDSPETHIVGVSGWSQPQTVG
jgi:hypothetical protein